MCLSNVLITGESNFDERNGELPRVFIRKEVTSYKIHTLDKYSNLPNNRVGPFNGVGGRFLRN